MKIGLLILTITGVSLGFVLLCAVLALWGAVTLWIVDRLGINYGPNIITITSALLVNLFIIFPIVGGILWLLGI